MTENRSEKTYQIIAATVILIAAVIFVIVNSIENGPYLYGGGGRTSDSGFETKMQPGHMYTLSGTCDDNSITGIALHFVSAGKGEVTAFFEVNGNAVGELVVSASDIRPDMLTRFVFQKELECFPEDSFELAIVYEGIPENAPALYTDNDSITARYEVIWDSISGESAALLTGSMVLLAGAIILLTVVNKVYDAEKRFIFLYVLTGICFIAALPLYRSPDEYAQFARVIEICRGQFISPEITLAPEALALGNANLASTTQRYIFSRADIALGWEQLDKAFFPNTSYFFPTAFLPHVILTFLTHLFTDRLIPLLYAARLGNFIGCGLVIWTAIKIIPYGKDTITAIALFPMSLQGFISASADGFSFSLFLLFISLILRARNDRRIFTGSEIITLYIVTLLFSLSKTAYTPMCLLLFLIPQECFGKKRNYWLNVILLGSLLVGINLLWIIHASSYPKLVETVDTAAQIGWIMKNPIEYIYVLINTIIDNGLSYLEQMVGLWLGWVNIGMPHFVIWIISAASLYVAIIDNSEQFRIGESIFIIILCGITLIAAMSAIYLQFNDTANGIIVGFQGRYLIPILVPVILALKKTKRGYRDTSLLFALIGIADAVCAGLVLLQTI